MSGNGNNKNFYGGYTHHNVNGRITGRSEPGLFGHMENYDQYGRRTGHSEPAPGGGYIHYNEQGQMIGRSEEDFLGNFTNYDMHGKMTGFTSNAPFGNSKRDSFDYCFDDTDEDEYYEQFLEYDEIQRNHEAHQNDNGEGCYIATCVYGSYDCPEVWTLRRFRDDILRKTAPGRAFVKCYYKLSPKMVERFGENKLFRKFWKNHLDKLIGILKNKGV